ncbi:MAG: TonB-dependent receptor [Bacteroidota bacterium]
MKKLFFFIVAVFISNDIYAQSILSGKVYDKSTNETIEGASVIIPDLKVGVVTNSEGNFILNHLPSKKTIIQVRMFGYALISNSVDLVKGENTINFYLLPQVLEKNEVVITGSAFTTSHAQSSLSVEPLEKKQLQSNGATNITEAISQVAGVSSISTGGGISKPVIRGLGYNRIVTINEGIRQEGQQWGDEHGLEIDQFAAERVEVLKGPASLLFGSDAIGGVINILAPLPASHGSINGEVTSQYQSNNHLYVQSAMLEGNQKGIVWCGRYTIKNAAAYSTPHQVVYNSAFNEANASGMIGINRKWGYQHVYFSSFQARYGMIEGDRDSNGLFVNHEGVSVSNAEALTRKLDLPFQYVNHYKISTLGSYFLKKGNLRTVFGWQKNQRMEFEDNEFIPGMSIDLTTMSADVKYYFPELKNYEVVIGWSGGAQANKNKGGVYLIPNYNSRETGVFASVKKTNNKWTKNVGLRYDYKNIIGDSLTSLFVAFNKLYAAWSGALGCTYEASDKLHFKGNLGRGFRIPNISELSANGIHEGTYRYEIGNPNLKPETSWQFDVGAGYENQKTGWELSLFYNYFNQFIYCRNAGMELFNSGNAVYPIFRYVQGNADFIGGEFSIDHHLTNQLHFENKFSYVKATNLETHLPIPYIPPFHFNSSLIYELLKNREGKLKSMQVSAQVDYFAKQNRIDSFETTTKQYSLISCGTNAHFESKHITFDIFCQVNNLTNVTYYNHLSRLKYIQVSGMGRNLTIGCSIPFGLVKH